MPMRLVISAGGNSVSIVAPGVLVMPLCWRFTHLEATGLLVRVAVFRRGNVEASGKNGTFRRLSQKGGIPLVSLRDGFLCGRTRVVLHPA